MGQARTEVIAYEIASAIGRDVDYVRTKTDTSGARKYMTGIEIAVLVGTALVVGFFEGLIKELAKTSGEAIGKAVATSALGALHRVRARLDGIDASDVPATTEEVTAAQRELDTIVSDIKKAVPPALYVENQMAVEAAATIEIVSTLRAYRFPGDSATRHAASTVSIMRKQMITKAG